LFNYDIYPALIKVLTTLLSEEGRSRGYLILTEYLSKERLFVEITAEIIKEEVEIAIKTGTYTPLPKESGEEERQLKAFFERVSSLEEGDEIPEEDKDPDITKEYLSEGTFRILLREATDFYSRTIINRRTGDEGKTKEDLVSLLSQKK
jgi:hypothetical protein